MFSITSMPNGIIHIKHHGMFTYNHWIKYQSLVMKLLDESQEVLYILSDFSKTTRFEKRVVLEAGTARHLKHEKLGLMVLYSNTTLSNFILQITLNRAHRENLDDRLRIQTDYERAMQLLLQHQSNGKADRDGSVATTIK